MKYYLAVFLLAVAVFVPQSEGRRDSLTHRNLILKIYDISIEDTLLELHVSRNNASSFRNSTDGIYRRRCEVVIKGQGDLICQRGPYVPFNTLHEEATQLITEGNELIKNMTTAIDSCALATNFDSCFRPQANTFGEIKRNYEQNSQRKIWDIYAATRKLSNYSDEEREWHRRFNENESMQLLGTH